MHIMSFRAEILVTHNLLSQRTWCSYYYPMAAHEGILILQKKEATVLVQDVMLKKGEKLI